MSVGNMCMRTWSMEPRFFSMPKNRLGGVMWVAYLLPFNDLLLTGHSRARLRAFHWEHARDETSGNVTVVQSWLTAKWVAFLQAGETCRPTHAHCTVSIFRPVDTRSAFDTVSESEACKLRGLCVPVISGGLSPFPCWKKERSVFQQWSSSKQSVG